MCKKSALVGFRTISYSSILPGAPPPHTSCCLTRVAVWGLQRGLQILCPPPAIVESRARSGAGPRRARHAPVGVLAHFFAALGLREAGA